MSASLPIQPTVTPATCVAGVLLLVSGTALMLLGNWRRWLQVYLSTFLLGNLCVTVLLVYVKNPPVGNAIQGAYLVAAVMSGQILGGGALLFQEVTEGLGCLLGGFCFSIWLLTLKSGGLVTSVGGKVLFIVAFALAAWSTSFTHYSRPFGIVGCTAFGGATAIVLGIDCFSKAGLKEFWIYVMGLNSNYFPLGLQTYPLTRGITTEIATIPILSVIGVLSQVKTCKTQKAKTREAMGLHFDEEQQRGDSELEQGQRLMEHAARERSRWEMLYGDPRLRQIYQKVKHTRSIPNFSRKPSFDIAMREFTPTLGIAHRDADQSFAYEQGHELCASPLSKSSSEKADRDGFERVDFHEALVELPTVRSPGSSPERYQCSKRLRHTRMSTGLSSSSLHEERIDGLLPMSAGEEIYLKYQLHSGFSDDDVSSRAHNSERAAESKQVRLNECFCPQDNKAVKEEQHSTWLDDTTSELPVLEPGTNSRSLASVPLTSDATEEVLSQPHTGSISNQIPASTPRKVVAKDAASDVNADSTLAAPLAEPQQLANQPPDSPTQIRDRDLKSIKAGAHATQTGGNRSPQSKRDEIAAWVETSNLASGRKTTSTSSPDTVSNRLELRSQASKSSISAPSTWMSSDFVNPTPIVSRRPPLPAGLSLIAQRQNVLQARHNLVYGSSQTTPSPAEWIKKKRSSGDSTPRVPSRLSFEVFEDMDEDDVPLSRRRDFLLQQRREEQYRKARAASLPHPRQKSQHSSSTSSLDLGMAGTTHSSSRPDPRLGRPLSDPYNIRPDNLIDSIYPPQSGDISPSFNATPFNIQSTTRLRSASATTYADFQALESRRAEMIAAHDRRGADRQRRNLEKAFRQQRIDIAMRTLPDMQERHRAAMRRMQAVANRSFST